MGAYGWQSRDGNNSAIGNIGIHPLHFQKTPLECTRNNLIYVASAEVQKAWIYM